MLDAGSVVATLGGKFNPAGFRSYDGAMKKAIGSATAAESAMVKSAERSAAATAALGATAEKASAAVTAASIKARQAALAVERAQLASASATEKYGAASVQARQAALGLTAAQQRLAVASNELAAAQGRAASANAALTTGTGKSSAAVSALGRASKTGAAVGLAVLAYGLIKSVGAASNFEQAMADVHAVTKANSRDMKLMSNAALDLGAKTGVGATKAAGALAELAKGGMSAKQSTDALRGTIALAQAGNMDLADAASTVVQSLSTFNLGAKDATMVADGLASAANKTTMDVSDFAQAFAQGGAAAQAAGMSFDETLNVMGAMANRFKSGSDMGTSLKTTLTQLAHPTKKAQAEMNRLNIDLFDAKGRFKDAADVTKQLGDRFSEMTPKQRLASAAIIAGSDGMRTLLNLANAPHGDSQIRVSGAAADTAKTKMDNLAGSWQRMKSNMENIGITVGNELVPKLRDATDAIVKFMDEAQKGKGDGGGFARFLKGVGKVAGELGDTLGAVTSPGKFADLMNRLTGHKNLSVEVTAKVKDEASQILNNIINRPLKNKVVRILGNKADVETKIRQLEKLGISGPTAHFLAEMGSVSAARAAVAAPIRVPVAYVPTVMKPNLPGGLPTKHKARGSGPDAGLALVGEGGAPEWVGNQRDGWGMVARPTILGLGPDDYVIPTEQRHRGRALDLLASAFGVAGYSKGKKPKTAGKKKQAQQDQRIQNAGTQADTADTRMQQAEEARRSAAFEQQKKVKLNALKRERSRLKAAVKTAKGSRKITLNNQLARVEADIQSTRLKQYEPRALADFGQQGRGLAENITAEVQGWLDDWDMKIALAQIDTPNDPTDDRAALTGKRDYLARTLAKARANPSLYGGASGVAQLASEMTSTARSITELDAPTLDQQAQADQQYQRGLAAGQTSFIDRLTAATVQGAAPSLVFQTYVPPSPSEARRLADHVVSGVDFQGGRPASSQRIGV